MAIAAAPFGLIDVNPVGCLIADASESFPFDKGFQEIKGMVVFLYPVQTDVSGDPSQDVAGQVRNSDPGQNQKSHVIGQQVEIFLSRLSIPVDKVI